MAEVERPDHQVDQGAVDRLHQRLLDAVNDPASRWSEQPMVAAGCLAGVTANLLRQVATLDPSQLPAIRRLLISMADLVAEAVTPPEKEPAGGAVRWH